MFDGLDISKVGGLSSLDMNWEFVDRLRGIWPRKLLIKGIVTREDAELAIALRRPPNKAAGSRGDVVDEGLVREQEGLGRRGLCETWQGDEGNAQGRGEKNASHVILRK